MTFTGKFRNQLKHSFDNIRNEKLKLNALQAVPFWIASLITGLLAVLYARLFALAEHGALYIFHWHSWLLFLFTPVCFLTAQWMVKKYAPYARGSGIPQVMVAIEMDSQKFNERVGKLLSIRVIFIKICSSLVMVLGGGVIGREGPTIQIAGSVFRRVNQWLPAWWPKISKRNMIMTGAAAGLAAAFNTPLGGVVFAVEELTRTHISYFKTAIFTAVIIAGLTAQGLLGPYLYLGYPNVTNISSTIFLGVILVSLISGFAGSAMAKLVLALIRWKSHFKFSRQHVYYILGCALTIAALAVFADERVLGSGKEIMKATLFTPDKYVPWYIPLMRMAGPVLSFTTGGAGGIFAPALGAGASIGSMLSGWMHLSDANTNLVILSGMVGFLTGVTRTPFTSAILVLEMTDRHSMIFHLMLAGLMANLAAMLVDKHSLYDHLKIQYIQQLNHDDREEELRKRAAVRPDGTI
jgi:H+/Cl- antiporter ClcA